MQVEDVLKYAACKLAMLARKLEISVERSHEFHGDGQGLNAISDLTCEISDLVDEVGAFACEFGDPGKYSDGRLVQSRFVIMRSVHAYHTWHPVIACEEPGFRYVTFSAAPGHPSGGFCELWADPATQDVRLRVVLAP